jgi:hypothetical protein
VLDRFTRKVKTLARFGGKMVVSIDALRSKFLSGKGERKIWSNLARSAISCHNSQTTHVSVSVGKPCFGLFDLGIIEDRAALPVPYPLPKTCGRANALQAGCRPSFPTMPGPGPVAGAWRKAI